MSIDIRPIAYSERLFAPLLEEAEAGNGAFLLRLRDEWLSGALRFEEEGEVLLGAFNGKRLIGVAGISHDPYAPAQGLGRVRHVYVLQAWRGRSVGRLLLQALIEHARGRFETLRLSARDRPAAIRLYESLGFVPCEDIKQTHRLVVTTKVRG
jgi:GNAT superfamily N-acetyltransferase